jgi:hypothetical protein
VSDTANAILADLLAAVRGSGHFAAVVSGPQAAETALPQATLSIENIEEFPSDESPAGRWFRLRASLRVTTRDDNSPAAVGRAVELAQLAADAIAADPLRSSLTCDLPIGLATEIDRIEMPRLQSAPLAEATLSIRCHYESEAN